jgi:hypothetical protein
VIRVGEFGTWFRTTLPRYGRCTHGGGSDKGSDANHGLPPVPQLAEAVGPELVRSELVNAYVGLLKDNEAEVRTAVAGQIPGIHFHL